MYRSIFLVLLAAVGILGHAAGVEVRVVDSAGQTVADAAAYAEPVDGKAPMHKGTVIIDQVNKEFVPLVTIMQTGTLVRFPNKDNIRHHVYSFSAAKTFDLPLYSGSKADPVLFDKPGQVILGCNIHDWMIAYALVVDTPWFGKTDTQGVVRIDDLPPGEYTLKVWHPYQLGEASAQHIRVGSSADDHFNFQLKLAPPPVRPRPKSQY